jgi:lysozyme family protein
MTDVDELLADLLTREGGYTNDPADPGGETNWGITVTTARAFGYQDAIRDMPVKVAASIYRQRYWVAPGFYKLDGIDSALAAKLFDIGVNLGPATGVRFLQRALKVLSTDEIAADGVLGDITLHVLAGVIAARGPDGRLVLLNMVRAQQSVAYIEDAERRPIEERFEYGWQRARAFL